MTRSYTAWIAASAAAAFLAACGGSEETYGTTSADTPPGAYETSGSDPAAPPPLEEAPPPMEPVETEPTSSVSDGEVEAFSTTQIELVTLQQQMAQRAQGGEDPNALRTELDARAAEVVQEAGLTLERYQQIAERLAVDGDLRARVEAAIEARL